MEQEYLVNPQTTGFVLGEKTSPGTRKCTFVRFKEASVLADLLRSVERKSVVRGKSEAGPGKF